MINTNEKFYIGLDIGTESVGFSATDGDYNVLKSSGKPLMGVRLFDEAQVSVIRRVKRANKVRKNRKKQRITLLQSLFNDEINKIDSLFFVRLSASSFWEDDKKKINEKLDLNSLFANIDFNDKTYFKKFKSIYHLRSYLMDEKSWSSEVKPDLRLVYLACHHILKHRGHFLWKAENIDFDVQGVDSIHQLNEKLAALFENDAQENIALLQLDMSSNFDEVLKVFQNNEYGKTKQQEELKKLFFSNESINKLFNKEIIAITKAVTGGTFNLNDLFDFDSAFEIEKEESKYSFENDWEEIAPKISNLLNDDDKFAVIENLKEIYSFAQLNKILNNNKSLSAAMIKKYNEYNIDLNSLKNFIKEVLPKKYYSIFRSSNEFKKGIIKTGNYANFVGSNLNKGKQILDKVDKQGFYEFLLNIFIENNLISKQKNNTYCIMGKANLTDKQRKILEKIIQKIENGVFLSKLRTKDNGVIPYQIHKYELVEILEKASNYYKFLNEEDNDENSTIKSVKDKIISLISYRIPYYVGRLNAYKGDYANRPVWAERKLSGVKITPWTIDNVIDYDKSAENFIGRMLSKCNYLMDETVLPKNSLLYSKFATLNELNNVKIRGVLIDTQLKQNIYNNLFMKEKNVSANKLLKYLKTIDNTLMLEDLSGFDIKGKGFNSSLSSYILATPIIEELKTKYSMSQLKAETVVENVILRQALHNDKSRVEKYIKNEYPEFCENLIKQLKGLNYSGFGNLSKKLLTSTERINLETGEIIQGKSIIDLLWETQENLMYIIYNPQYKIKEWIDFVNNKTAIEFSFNDIAESYGASSVKRAVWESVKIINELIKLNGNKTPDKIFVEVTRETKNDKKGKRTSTRKKQIEELYKAAKNLNKDILELLKSKTDAEMRSDKLFLYCMQNGKCAYSGDPIDINDLMNNNIYDIDHIIPQSLIKDDSINNRVLAKRVLNSKKDKNYPLNKTDVIWRNINALYPMWQSWEKAGLMNSVKFERLIRTTELSEKELEGFIARQLVFSGQSATLVANLLTKRFAVKNDGGKVPEIVYSKAGNVSDFRQKFDIVKCRDVNDIHHCQDAYLNIVVGNVYNIRFNHNRNFWRDDLDKFKQFSLNHIFEYEINGAYKIGAQRPKREMFGDDGKGIINYRQAVKDWYQSGQTITKVKKVISKNWYPVTMKVLENKGVFYNETIYGIKIKQKQVKLNTDGEKILMEDKATAIPLKGLEQNPRHNYKKYGYFTSKNPAYFMIVEYTLTKGNGKNKKEYRQREFVSVPIIDLQKLRKTFKTDIEIADEIIKEYNFKNPKIIVAKIYKNTLFELNGTPVRIRGFVEWQNAVQWYADSNIIKYIKLLSKYKDLLKKKILKEEDWIKKDEIIVADSFNKQKITKEDNIILFNAIKKQLEKEIYKGNTALYKKITKEMKAKFEDLLITKQVNILTEMLKATACNARRGNIKDIGGGDSFGRFAGASVKISTPLVLIEESVTGNKSTKTVIYPFN